MNPGDEFGPSSWIVVDQERIDAFADATGDHQWIHVDPEQARAGPFGQTIGHGYLTLSLLPVMSYEVVPRQEGGMAINYGLNKVRFPAPVPSGSRVRGSFTVVDDRRAGVGASRRRCRRRSNARAATSPSASPSWCSATTRADRRLNRRRRVPRSRRRGPRALDGVGAGRVVVLLAVAGPASRRRLRFGRAS